MESPNGPLAGVRVVDAGDATLRWAGKLLADAGADVVRVRRGPPGPSLGDVGGGHGVLAWWLDGGTRYVDAPPHSDGFRELVARADILLESEPPGTLDGAQLRADNPSLVHVALTPFGQDGPRASWRSSDLVAAALGGVLSVNGLPDEPLPIWGRQTETVGGLYAASAALAGLCSVRAGGGGLSIDLSLQQAVMACTEHLFMFWWHPERLAPFGAPEAVRQGSLHWVRGYEVMNCARGACMVSPTAGGVFDLIAYLQAEGFGTDLPAVPTPTEMLARVEQYMAALRQLAATKDATELFEKGQAMHVPFGEVLTVAQVVRNAQLTARGSSGRCPAPMNACASPGRWRASPAPRSGRPPRRPGPPPRCRTWCSSGARGQRRCPMTSTGRSSRRRRRRRRRFRAIGGRWPGCACSTSPTCWPARSPPGCSVISAPTSSRSRPPSGPRAVRPTTSRTSPCGTATSAR
ncbi:MAG: CoA transferase [Acidimicrobiales bacterium]